MQKLEPSRCGGRHALLKRRGKQQEGFRKSNTELVRGPAVPLLLINPTSRKQGLKETCAPFPSGSIHARKRAEATQASTEQWTGTQGVACPSAVTRRL